MTYTIRFFFFFFYKFTISDHFFAKRNISKPLFFAKRNISKNAMHHYYLGIFGYQFWLSLGIISHTCPQVIFSFFQGGRGGGGGGRIHYYKPMIDKSLEL